MKNDRRRSSRPVAILLTLTTVAVASLGAASLYSAPPSANTAAQPSPQSPPPPIATTKGMAEEAFKKKAQAGSRRAKALYRQKKYAEAAAQFIAAAHNYDAAKWPISAAYMYGWKGDCHRNAKDYRAAVKSYSECVRRCVELKQKGIKGLALNAGNLAKALKQLKRYEDAAKAYGQSAEAYRQLKQPPKAAKAQFNRAVALYRGKKYRSAADSFDRAVVAYQKAKDTLNVAWTYGWKGDALRDAKDDRAAVKAYTECVRRFGDLKEEDLKGLSLNASRLGKALKRLRRYADAAKAFQQAADAYERRKRAADSAWMYGWKGDAHRDGKESQAAVKAYTECVRRFARLNEKGFTGLALNAESLGRELRGLKQYDLAATAYGQSAEAYRQLKQPPKAAKAQFNRAVALYRGKKYQSAIDGFNRATQAYLEAEDTLNVARMYGWKGHSHRNAGDDKVAVEAYADSVRRFARLGKDGLKGLSSIARELAKALERLERFDEAVQALDQVVAARSVLHGPKHYRTIDARLDIADLRQRAKLTDEQLRQLAEADRWNAELVRFYKQGKYAEAVVIARKVLRVRQDVLGLQHRDTSTSLNNLAAVYTTMEHYAKAEPFFRQALAISENIFGKNHPDYARTLNNLARLHMSLGDHAKAEPLYRQALAIREKALGLNHADYAVSLNDLAELYKATGDYAKAEPLIRQTLTIRKKALGENHPVYATSLNNLAMLYQGMGDYAKAGPLYRQALAVWKKALGENHPSYATSLNNLAALYQSMGDYAKAEPLHRQALAIRKKALGENHPDYATSLNKLAELYHALGDYAKADPLYRRALAIRKKALGENHPDYATSLNNLAALYESMGDYAKAEPLYRQALAINRKALGENHPSYAASLTNLAGLYKSMGDYAKLAGLYDSMGDYAKAEPLYRQALAIWKKASWENHPSYASSLNNLAMLYQGMGDYAKAGPLHRQALAIRKKALGENHPSYASSLNNLAYLYMSIGDYAKAEPLFRQASEVWKKALGENHPCYAASLNNLSLLYESMGDYAKAEPLYQPALSISRAVLERTSLVQSERQQLAMGQMLRYQLDAYISLALRKGDIPRQAFREILLWKGATLVRQRQYRQVANEPAVAELFKKLQTVTMQLSSLARAFPAKPKQVTGWKTRIAALTAEKEKLEAELSRKSAAFRKAKREITVADVAVALPKNAVLVDFLEFRKSTPPDKPGGKIVYRRSLVASVLHPDGRVSLIDLGPTAVVSTAIQAWRKTFGLSRQGVMAGRLLRKTLWDPLLPAIGNAKTVLVSPDGVLGRLPLGALPGKKPGTYLLEEYRLALIPVPQLLPTLVNEQGRKALHKNLLLMGGVDYDAAPSGNPSKSRSVTLVREGVTFSPLPGTLREVTGLDALFREVFHAGSGDVTTLKLGTATEARFRRLAPQFFHLHLATHGFFASPKKQSALSSVVIAQATRSLRGGVYGQRATAVQGFSPGLLSGLAFAGANRPPQPDSDDGILTAEEIAFLPLDRVQLVTLSACETGLGASAGGEGLLGVQRAFQVSGARSTVASYWKVDDRVTQLMMQRFYRNLWEKKMPRLDALREAQLWLLHHPKLLSHPNQVRGLKIIDPQHDPRRSAAYYWAAFVLSGDWR